MLNAHTAFGIGQGVQLECLQEWELQPIWGSRGPCSPKCSVLDASTTSSFARAQAWDLLSTWKLTGTMRGLWCLFFLPEGLEAGTRGSRDAGAGPPGCDGSTAPVVAEVLAAGDMEVGAQHRAGSHLLCTSTLQCNALPSSGGRRSPWWGWSCCAASPQAPLHCASHRGLQVTHCHLPEPQISEGKEEGEGD